ncbi:pyridoxamine 5'-phosphate oxidase family protein [Streptomyces sp. NPDC051018]|uniref:pyridoxamine 5'-phosphate oxidase family protein n=1 Tax=Streptomyces sp. NPDC051018 TaxID=3365639 RepID=UPI0037A98AD7
MTTEHIRDDGTHRPLTERVRVRRRAERGSYDPAQVNAILDEALICRVAFVDDGRPYVLPTLHTRIDDTLYFHASQQNRMFKRMLEAPVCVEATVIDSLVLGRSLFQNSMNFRSVVALGNPYEVTGADAKLRAMVALMERVVPGRADEVRPLTDAELRSVRVLALTLEECSAKIRSGPPGDKESDFGLPVWAGELPLRIVPGEPVDDPDLRPGNPAREHIRSWGSSRSGV